MACSKVGRPAIAQLAGLPHQGMGVLETSKGTSFRAFLRCAKGGASGTAAIAQQKLGSYRSGRMRLLQAIDVRCAPKQMAYYHAGESVG